MTTSGSLDPTTLGRYLDGTAVPEERAAVERWVGGDPERRTALAGLRAAWQADVERLDAPFDVEAAWARLAAGRGLPAERPRWARPGALAAGVIAVVIGAGAVWWVVRAPRSGRSTPAMREYVTPPGRRAVFRLLDGTEITLNADTRLSAPASFGERERKVSLEGEAYFRVVHDAARPFVVHTSAGEIRDVGTAFDVRAYHESSRERVAVLEGAVALAATTLRAGQVATRSRAGAVRLVPGARVADELAWTRGRLVFTSVPLGEAAARLSRWYDLDVRIADPALVDRPVTGSYGDEPVTQVLTLITAAVGARYDWHGRSVTISLSHRAR
ncbi:MAG TPA: FecR domain-containing protein [Gemmatimonadales bacterium]|nr:FecR domain-containing protein [Gemmatimonadales bacterium]